LGFSAVGVIFTHHLGVLQQHIGSCRALVRAREPLVSLLFGRGSSRARTLLSTLRVSHFSGSPAASGFTFLNIIRTTNPKGTNSDVSSTAGQRMRCVRGRVPRVKDGDVNDAIRTLQGSTCALSAVCRTDAQPSHPRNISAWNMRRGLGIYGMAAGCSGWNLLCVQSLPKLFSGEQRDVKAYIGFNLSLFQPRTC